MSNRRNNGGSIIDQLIGGDFFATDGKVHGSPLLGNQRLNFVRKVFGIVFFQLLATTAFTMFVSMNRGFAAWMAQSTGMMYLTMFGAIATMLIITFSPNQARTVPNNYYLLAAFTFCESWSVASIVQFYNTQIILVALIGTLGIVTALTFYAMTTKKDFTMMGGSIFMFAMGMLLLSLFNWAFQVPLVSALLIVGGCILEGYYLIFDIQLICGQKRGKFGIDDYILAAINLYIDIIRIFLKLLEILQKLEKSNEEEKKERK